MFQTIYDDNHDLDPRVTWVTSSHRYKETWLRTHGFHLNYSKIPNYYDLPNHVRDKWDEENRA